MPTELLFLVSVFMILATIAIAPFLDYTFMGARRALIPLMLMIRRSCSCDQSMAALELVSEP